MGFFDRWKIKSRSLPNSHPMSPYRFARSPFVAQLLILPKNAYSASQSFLGLHLPQLRPYRTKQKKLLSAERKLSAFSRFPANCV
jgi:hypothetical protein